MGTHSSIGQEAGQLGRWAKRTAKSLQKKRPDKTSFIFCYSGMSGVSLATALALEYSKLDKKFGMLYVRKKDEKSHGSDIEFNGDYMHKKNILFVFVDDFSDSGRTRSFVIKKARQYMTEEHAYEIIPKKFYQVFQNDTIYLQDDLPKVC